jgi:hypothetical protein
MSKTIRKNKKKKKKEGKTKEKDYGSNLAPRKVTTY